MKRFFVIGLGLITLIGLSSCLTNRLNVLYTDIDRNVNVNVVGFDIGDNVITGMMGSSYEHTMAAKGHLFLTMVVHVSNPNADAVEYDLTNWFVVTANGMRIPITFLGFEHNFGQKMVKKIKGHSMSVLQIHYYFAKTDPIDAFMMGSKNIPLVYDRVKFR